MSFTEDVKNSNFNNKQIATIKHHFTQKTAIIENWLTVIEKRTNDPGLSEAIDGAQHALYELQIMLEFINDQYK